MIAPAPSAAELVDARAPSRNEVRAWLDANQALWEGVDPEVSAWTERYGRRHADHYREVARLVAETVGEGRGQRTLDVGAFPGHLSALLAEAGFAVEAVDLAPERAGSVFAAAGVEAHRVDIEAEALPFADDSADLVLFCEVLEHLRVQPLRALTEIGRVLRPGGTLIASVPNITPLMRWAFLRGRDYQGDPVAEYAKLEEIGHMGHVRIFSSDEVRRMLARGGLEVTGMRPGGSLDGSGKIAGWILRRATRSRMRKYLYLVATVP